VRGTKITNDGLTRSCTGCIHMTTVGVVKELIEAAQLRSPSFCSRQPVRPRIDYI